MLSLMWPWTHGLKSNGVAVDLRRYDARNDVSVMWCHLAALSLLVRTGNWANSIAEIYQCHFSWYIAYYLTSSCLTRTWTHIMFIMMRCFATSLFGLPWVVRDTQNVAMIPLVWSTIWSVNSGHKCTHRSRTFWKVVGRKRWYIFAVLKPVQDAQSYVYAIYMRGVSRLAYMLWIKLPCPA